MRVILVEFPWQAKEIISNKDSFKKDVVVSLDAESSYLLKSNKVAYFESYQFCNYKEFWGRYKEITDRSIKIAKFLDEALWYADKRYRDINWKFFDDHHYLLKISFDQLFYYSELISKLIKKFNPTEIIVADTNKILVNDNFLISSEISVIKYLLKTFEDDSVKIKVSFVSQIKNEKLIFSFFENLSKFRFFLKTKVVNLYYKINFLFNYYLSKPIYLSIGCFEIDRYKKLYPSESRFFLNYRHNNSRRKKNIKDLNFKNFIDYLRNKTHFFDLIRHKNISFELIFYEILAKSIQQLNFLLDEYENAKGIINRIKPKCVIFQTMVPFNSAVVAFRKNCIDLNIPIVTWAHGGYGVVSLVGYDVTDFRFCKNHISYGPYLENEIAKDTCVLKKLELHKNQKIFPVGSCRFDYDNIKKNSKKILKTVNKRTVLFFYGSIISKNHFYFGRNREKCETSLWEFHYDVIYLLKKYQNKYNIIFKDYPNGYKSLWKKVLSDIKAENISYISNEMKINELLRISDLNIFPWFSTPFFESLYFEPDIFIIDEDLFEKSLDENLKDEIFYFSDTKNFLLGLEKYLEVGNFYTCTKKNSRNYYLKLDGINKRDKLLNDALSKIN